MKSSFDDSRSAPVFHALSLETVRAALDRAGCKPTPSGSGYAAFCPVHEADGQGHKPSLSIAPGDKQPFVVHCHAGCAHGDIMAALGIEKPAPVKPINGKRKIVATYSYCDLQGIEVRQKVRYEPKDFRIRHQANGDWVYKAGEGPAVLYRLPELNRFGDVFFCEGEKDVDRLAALGLCATCNIEGAAQPNQKPKWRPEYTQQLAGAERLILLPDNDDAGRAHMRHIASQLRGKAGEIRWLELPGLPEKGDVSDWLNAGHTADELRALTEEAEEKNFSDVKTPTQSSQRSQCSQDPGDVHAIIEDALARCAEDPGVLMNAQFLEAWRQIQAEDPEEALRIRVRVKRAKPSGVLLADLDRAVRGESDGIGGDSTIADDLVALVLEQELFHDAENAAFVTVTNGVRKTFKIGTQAFSDWLSFAYYKQTAAGSESGIGRAASETALKTAVVTLSGIAKHDREERPCYLRVAPWNGGYIIDLGDDAWRVIEVQATGWRILDQSPVRFWRPNPMQGLPIPTPGGSIDALWDFVNVPEECRLLVLAWILEAWRPDTPFTILEQCGQQGSAKSFSQDKLRRLIDPNAVNLRSAPKSTEDLFVGAGCNWLVSLNNLSHLTPQQQDALCTLATGGGFAARTLYTNADETLIECKRPVIMNGIVPMATAQDLVDRIIHLELPEIAAYREEGEINAAFEKAAPGIFAGLLDLFSSALARLPDIRLRRPPRMADFARLGEALSQTLGNTPGHFVDLFAGNRRQSVARSLESSPIGSAIRELADAKPSALIFEGTMKQLLYELENYRQGTDAWPKSPRGLGDALRRQRPALKTLGLEISISAPGREGVTVRIQRKAEVREHCEHREHRVEVFMPEKNFSGKPAEPESPADDLSYHHQTQKTPAPADNAAPAEPAPMVATSILSPDAKTLSGVLKLYRGWATAQELAHKSGLGGIERTLTAAQWLVNSGLALIEGGMIKPTARLMEAKA